MAGWVVFGGERGRLAEKSNLATSSRTHQASLGGFVLPQLSGGSRGFASGKIMMVG